MAFGRSVLQAAGWDPMLGGGPRSLGYGEEQLFEYMAREAGARITYAVGRAAVHDFDRTRLSVPMMLAEAVKKGRSDAYIAYHWSGKILPMPRLRAVRRRVRAEMLKQAVGERLDEAAASAAAAIHGWQFARAMASLRREEPKYIPRPRRYGIVNDFGIDPSAVADQTIV
jgi:hypothetical protein